MKCEHCEALADAIECALLEGHEDDGEWSLILHRALKAYRDTQPNSGRKDVEAGGMLEG